LPGDPVALLVQRLRHDVATMADPITYLVHEYLLDENSPCYFGEFLQDIEAFELRYVDDALPASTSLESLPQSAQQWIREMGTDVIDQQQYIDFVGNVSFRRSLLCRHQHTVRYDGDLDRFRSLYATATCTYEKACDGVMRVRTDLGREFSSENPQVQSILETLVNRRPCSVPVTQLLDILGKDNPISGAADILGELHCNAAALEFSTVPYPCTREITPRPRVTELVRLQVRDGLVSSAAHRPVAIDDVLVRRLVQLLDGTRTIPEIIMTLKGSLKPDKPIDDEQWERLVRQHLTRLADLALLSNEP
jgi:methyltransferase-like protein